MAAADRAHRNQPRFGSDRHTNPLFQVGKPRFQRESVDTAGILEGWEAAGRQPTEHMLHVMLRADAAAQRPDLALAHYRRLLQVSLFQVPDSQNPSSEPCCTNGLFRVFSRPRTR